MPASCQDAQVSHHRFPWKSLSVSHSSLNREPTSSSPSSPLFLFFPTPLFRSKLLTSEASLQPPNFTFLLCEKEFFSYHSRFFQPFKSHSECGFATEKKLGFFIWEKVLHSPRWPQFSIHLRITLNCWFSGLHLWGPGTGRTLDFPAGSKHSTYRATPQPQFFTILKVIALNDRTSKYMRQKLQKIKRLELQI